MKKRLLTTCLSLFFVTSAFALASCETTEENVTGLAFELVDGNYTVIGRGTCEEGIVDIPAEYNGLPVTAIAENAFANDQILGIVTIPDSVETIGEGAFSDCINLTKVTMGSGVAEIGSKAFYSCGWLSNLTLSKTLDSIGKSAFYGCRRLKTVDFPDSLKTISDNAFDYCDWLEEVNFGTSLEVIGKQAFLNCVKLKAVEIPDGAPTEIRANAFELCSSIKYVTLGDSVTSIGSNAFLEATHIKELVIGDSVESIGDYAFNRCTRIYKVTLGAGVTTISDTAFSDCRTIREVYNRSSLNIVAGTKTYGEIAENALYVRTGDEPSKITIDEQGVLYMMEGKKKVVVGAALDDYTDILLPDDVYEIASRAFYNEDYVRSIDTGDGCKIIGKNAFRNCYHLEKVALGKSVISVGSGTFYANGVLVTVVIRGTLEKGVGSSAFAKKRDESGALAKGNKNFANLFFEGTSEEWELVKKNFKSGNEDLISNSKTTISFYSETKPTSSGKYWHYVGETPTLWK